VKAVGVEEIPGLVKVGSLVEEGDPKVPEVELPID